MRSSYLALAVGALLSSAVLAQAQPAPAQGGNGAWRQPQTLAQFQQRYRERILSADGDHDGRVSLAEWTAAHPPRDGGEGGRGDPARQFQMLDPAHDGSLTPAETAAASEARFARMDANHDGVLTPDERMAMRHRGGLGRSGDGEVPPPQ